MAKKSSRVLSPGQELLRIEGLSRAELEAEVERHEGVGSWREPLRKRARRKLRDKRGGEASGRANRERSLKEHALIRGDYSALVEEGEARPVQFLMAKYGRSQRTIQRALAAGSATRPIH